MSSTASTVKAVGLPDDLPCGTPTVSRTRFTTRRMCCRIASFEHQNEETLFEIH